MRVMWHSVWISILLSACGSSNDTKETTDDTNEPAPPFEWETAPPSGVDMDEDLLNGAVALIEKDALAIDGMMVVKEGKIVLEHYFDGDADTPHRIESSTKSITSLLAGIAIREGLIEGIETPVLDHFDDRTFEHPSNAKAAITIEDLLTMQSGLDYDNTTESFQSETDSVAFILDHDMKHTPGEEWVYSSADTQLLGAIIEDASGMSLDAYATVKLFDKLGINPGPWTKDGSGRTVAGYGLQLVLRDMAKLGLLMLDHGRWSGETIVDGDWIEASLRTRAETPWTRGDFGYSWWIMPSSWYRAGGRGGQQINFFPDEDLVVVYTASLPDSTADATLDTITRAFVLGVEAPPDTLASASEIEDTCNKTKATFIESDGLPPFVNGVVSVGDGVSTQCLLPIESQTICMHGVAADAANYTNWGAAMSLRLASPGDDDEMMPFDATGMGIAGVRFNLTGEAPLPHGLRVGMTMVNRDDLSYEEAAYIIGGSWTGDIKRDGEIQFSFDDLGMPEWVDQEILQEDRPFDATEIHSLRFQTPTQPGGPYAYDFCIFELTWLDAELNPIDTP